LFFSVFLRQAQRVSACLQNLVLVTPFQKVADGSHVWCQNDGIGTCMQKLGDSSLKKYKIRNEDYMERYQELEEMSKKVGQFFMIPPKRFDLAATIKNLSNFCKSFEKGIEENEKRKKQELAKRERLIKAGKMTKDGKMVTPKGI